jgi:hypothetical protein
MLEKEMLLEEFNRLCEAWDAIRTMIILEIENIHSSGGNISLDDSRRIQKARQLVRFDLPRLIIQVVKLMQLSSNANAPDLYKDVINLLKNVNSTQAEWRDTTYDLPQQTESDVKPARKNLISSHSVIQGPAIKNCKDLPF